MVLSNHPDLADQVRSFGTPFVHIPAHKEIRAEAEQRQLDLLRHNVDLVVLARYMQILTPRFLLEPSNVDPFPVKFRFLSQATIISGVVSWSVYSSALHADISQCVFERPLPRRDIPFSHSW